MDTVNTNEEEQIPSLDKLFYHVAKNDFAPYFDYNDIPYHIFTPQGKNGLSVNWEKYCKTAMQCLLIKTDLYPNGRTSKTHGVGHFITNDVKEIELLSVIHSPSALNKAHSLIIGLPPNKPRPPFNQIRKELKRIFRHWDIKPEE